MANDQPVLAAAWAIPLNGILTRREIGWMAATTDFEP